MKRQMTREKLAIKIAERLSAILDHEVNPNLIKLYPAKGYWTHTHQDVMGFQGGYSFSGHAIFSIGSWNNMTDCLRFGFILHDCRNEYRAEAHFMIEALKVRNPII